MSGAALPVCLRRKHASAADPVHRLAVGSLRSGWEKLNENQYDRVKEDERDGTGCQMEGGYDCRE